MRFTFDIGRKTRKFLRELLTPQTFTIIQEPSVMFVVPADNPDVEIRVTAPVAKDKEGNIIPLNYSGIITDNESAVSIVTDTDNGTTFAHFGAPELDGDALANLNATWTHARTGAIVKSIGAQVTIVVGDADTVEGGTIELVGLSESE